MKKEREFGDNPYGKSGDSVTKQIIERAIRDFSAQKTEKTIGDMEDEILKKVHEKLTYI